MKLYFLDKSRLMIDRRMKCEYAVAKPTLYLLVAILETARGECPYYVEFSDDLESCPDFDNEIMKCESLTLNMVAGKGGGMALSGTINLEEDIVQDTMMTVEIWKVMEIGKEYMYHAEGDICSHLKDETAPWFPLIAAMKISECPIRAKRYVIKDMVMNISHAERFLNHEMLGPYSAQLSMMKDLKKISCYQTEMEMFEHSHNETNDPLI